MLIKLNFQEWQLESTPWSGICFLQPNFQNVLFLCVPLSLHVSHTCKCWGSRMSLTQPVLVLSYNLDSSCYFDWFNEQSRCRTLRATHAYLSDSRYPTFLFLGTWRGYGKVKLKCVLISIQRRFGIIAYREFSKVHSKFLIMKELCVGWHHPQLYH